MNTGFEAILEAALKLPQNERFQLVEPLETLPSDGITMSIDNPLLHEELRRRWDDGSELIPWSELRDEWPPVRRQNLD